MRGLSFDDEETWATCASSSWQVTVPPPLPCKSHSLHPPTHTVYILSPLTMGLEIGVGWGGLG
jgi:hypothetical protein